MSISDVPRWGPKTFTKGELADLREQWGDLLLLDGFDGAFLGVVDRCGSGPVSCYSIEGCIAILLGQGMDDEDAWEHFDYNVRGGWLGESTPYFLTSFSPATIED